MPSENWPSILQSTRCCYICGTTGDLHLHHIFGGIGNRKKSDEDKMCIFLCPAHHNMSNNGIHFNKKFDTMVKQQGEKIWIEKYTSEDLDWEERVDEFRKRYGKSYL